jgi:hypothetical protein
MPQEITMSRTTLAVLTATAFVATALVATSASAKPNPHNGPVVQKPIKNPPVIGLPKPNKPPVIGLPKPGKPPVIGYPNPNKPPKPPFPGGHPIGGNGHHHHPDIIVEREVIVTTPVVTAAPSVRVVRPARAPAPRVVSAPVKCLTKQYLADGTALFMDVCTKEFAVATPEQLQAEADGTMLPPR